MNIKRRIVCVLAMLTLLISILVPNVVALVKEKSMKDLIKDSDSIIVGKVIDKKPYWEEGKIFTDVMVLVDMRIKGNSDIQIVVKVPGGAVGDINAEVSDAPFFENGEEVLLFSKGNEVVGWNQGKFTIKNDKIKETGESLAEFVHKIKKEGQIKNEKGKPGRDIDVVSEKLNTKSIVQIPASGSKGNIVAEPSLIDDAWLSIKYEGFEEAFPNNWTLYGSPTWCENNYKSAAGSWSGWPACAGTGAVPSSGKYPNNLNSWMVYGPFSLVGATDALVTFKHWTDTESNYDFFQYMASIDGSNFYGQQLSGDWTPWKDATFDLKSVYTLGDLRGQDRVWIAFRFVSDNTVQDYGTFLDEINIQKDTTPSTAPHIIDITPDSGQAKSAQLGSSTAAVDSTQVIINGTNFGTTAGSAKFWRIGTTTYDATIVSWTDTQIVAKVPGRISSYTKPDGTGNVQVVKSDGTPSDNYGYFRVTYSYGGGKWPINSVTYKVNPNTADTTGELEAVQAATNTWNTAGSTFAFLYEGSTAKTDYVFDGENSIAWVNYDTGSIATTISWWYISDPTTIIESDIIFNDHSFNWGIDGYPTKMDVETIALHELGHWLQLLDMYGSADSGKVMHGYGSYGSIKRTLSADDTAGIVAIYGMNGAPNVPADLTQFKSDGSTSIPVGETTTESTVVTKGVVSDPNSDTVQLEVEVKPVGTAFANTPTCISDAAVASGSTASATCSGLANGQYHWQARAKDSHNVTGSWLSAGDNLENSPDFIVSPASSSITVISPNGGEMWARGTTHTITWSSIGSPGQNVKIELLKNGAVDRTIVSRTRNDGSYSWRISSSQVPGTDYKIQVISTSNTAFYDTSDDNFKIS